MVKPDAIANQNKFSYDPEVDHNNNFKFAVIVPHTFIDSTSGEAKAYESFSYSFTQNKKIAQPSFLLQTTISFEFSPVTMVITKEKKPLTKFLINLCAIVGGAFVVFGILNSTV